MKSYAEPVVHTANQALGVVTPPNRLVMKDGKEIILGPVPPPAPPNLLVLKNGKKMVLGKTPPEIKRDGAKRQARWDEGAKRLRFEAGGSRRFPDAVAALRWAKARNYELI